MIYANKDSIPFSNLLLVYDFEVCENILPKTREQLSELLPGLVDYVSFIVPESGVTFSWAVNTVTLT